MANGIAGRILMMGQHLAQKKIPNVELMLLPRAGQYYQVRQAMKEKN